MKLNKIHHVAVICSDYEQSKYFYTEVLSRQAVCVLQRPRRTADRTVRNVKNHHLSVLPDSQLNCIFAS